MRWTWGVVLALAAGCEGIDLEQLVERHPALTRVVLVPAGEDCPRGGRALQAGADVNGNGLLDDAEVTSTERVCATALVRKRPEPAGTHCVHGGQAVQTGVDVDANGQLDDAEVTATEYLCATLLPQVLVRVQAVGPGEQCPDGGQRTRAGNDTNGNGELEDGEITREAYGCTERAPVVTRVRPSPPGACQGGGSAVEAGPDVDRDGVLDDAERRASLDVCADTSRVLMRLQAEPPGEGCPAGGTGLRAGEDLNGDGELSDVEPSSSTRVCQELHTYQGSYRVQGPADLAALQGISRLRGSLQFAQTGLTEVVLPGLAVVEGMLVIDSNASLSRLELPGLRFVGQHVSVFSNPLLETLVLGGGQQERLWMEMGLTVDGNPRLPNVNGLRWVVPRQSLILSNNDALQHNPRVDQGFIDLQSVSAEVVVTNNDALGELPLSRLHSTGGSVVIEGNAALRSLSGLGGLITTGGDLVIMDNDGLRDLSGLKVESMQGSLHIAGNDGLLTTEGVQTLTRAWGVSIVSNASLETAGDMPLLETLVANLSLFNNPKLREVRNLAALRDLAGIVLTDNPLLTGLPGLAGVRHLDALRVGRNAALTSLADFGGLRSLRALSVADNASLVRLSLGALQSVSSEFMITANPLLPTCQATALASVYTGEPEWFRISGNDDAATCGH